MTSLKTALQEWKAQELDDRSAGLLAEDLIELELISGWLELERARRVAAFEAQRGQDLEGHSSTTAYLKHRCRMTGSRAQRIVAMAHKLRELRFVEKATAVGDLSLDQMRMLVSLPDCVSEQLARDEVTLVNAVSELSVADTRRVVDYWRSAVDGPGADLDADEMVNQRYVHASRTFQGMVKGDFLLDPLAGEVVLEDLATATPPRREGDDRTARQRRADALSDIARSFLDSGEASGSEKPHLLVLTDLDALQGRGCGVQETVSGQVLTPEQMREIACDATITRVVFGPDGEPTDIGRASRVIPPAMRRAVIARDRHCQHPGCDRPARWCDIHHVFNWADGGVTAVWALKLLCRFHHTWEHRRSRSHSP